jgi:hypothetical protein
MAKSQWPVVMDKLSSSVLSMCITHNWSMKSRCFFVDEQRDCISNSSMWDHLDELNMLLSWGFSIGVVGGNVPHRECEEYC